MAISQADVDNLEAALASGELTVEQDGRRVTYRSVAEIKAALGYAREQLAASTAAAAPTQSLAAYSRD